jgi:hypothetical protein
MSEGSKRRYNNRKEKGLCTVCGKKPPIYGLKCEMCAERTRKSSLAHVQRLKDEGRCRRCATQEGLIAYNEKAPSKIYCRSCYFKMIASKTVGTSKHWKILEAQFEKQNGLCAYTGEQLIIGLNDSPDHILPVARFPEYANDPYNIEWTTVLVNFAKRDMTRDEFLAMVHQIARNTT